MSLLSNKKGGDKWWDSLFCLSAGGVATLSQTREASLSALHATEDTTTKTRGSSDTRQQNNHWKRHTMHPVWCFSFMGSVKATKPCTTVVWATTKGEWHGVLRDQHLICIHVHQQLVPWLITDCTVCHYWRTNSVYPCGKHVLQYCVRYPWVYPGVRTMEDCYAYCLGICRI